MRFRCFFTLVELLTVIAIIALLVSILLPSLTKAKAKANEMKCKGQMSQCGLAFMSYANDFNGWIPAVYWNMVYWDWRGWSGWQNSTVPWICKLVEQGYIPKPTKSTIPAVSICPMTDTSSAMLFYCTYGMNSYLGFRPDDTSTQDCPKNIFKLRKNSRNLLLADKDDLTVPEVSGPYHGIYVSSRHGGGSNILYLDGHVKWVKKSAMMSSTPYNVE